METPRFLHEHPLKLVNHFHLRVGEDDEGDALTCDHCDDELSGRVYACDECGFYLHEACANLPQSLRHPFHPCLLFLKLVPISADGAAEPQHMMIFYRCETCNFELDDSDALWQPAFREGPLYCGNGHLLKLSYDEEANAKPPCYGCKERTSGKYYVCLPCEYYAHEDCAFSPYKIRHFFHSCPLFLRAIDGDNCGACLQKCYHTNAYHCEECNFVMHPRCSQFSPIGSDEEGILHWSHHHPLKLAYEEADETRPNCWGCAKPISGKSYACLSCNYFLHLSCANLPQEIQHFFHGCPLLLRTTVGRFCDGCQHDISKTFSYWCKKCDFDMHVECTEFMPIGSNEEGILHWSHQHPLKLTYKEADETPSMCRGCEKPKSEEFYACHSCGFYLHLSCANLPQEIHHFLHGCPLSLKVVYRNQCDACFNKCDGVFGYCCEECEFSMHVECAQFQCDESSIQDLSHHHPLKLSEADYIDCNLCARKITGKEAYGGCNLCEFFIHKSCMGLPKTHKSTRYNPIISKNGPPSSRPTRSTPPQPPPPRRKYSSPEIGGRPPRLRAGASG